MAKTQRTFTPEFKAEAVKPVTARGRSLAELARDLDPSESLLRSGEQAPAAHSDRGRPYAGAHSRGPLAHHGITCRLSRRGNRWGDAPRGSCFAGLKEELTPGESLATGEEARSSLFGSIEVLYNRVRRHSSPGYRSPVDYERAG